MVHDDAFRARLADAGLNLTGVASAAAWNAAMPPARQTGALLPGARAILVIGNGGSALWNAFLEDLRADPRRLTDEPHPLDAFVRRRVADADPLLGEARRRWFWATADADVHLDFRVLAHLAGLGAPSRLGLLLHPKWGVWMGLRAACLLDAELPFSTPSTAAPCVGCPAPCRTACPAGALDDGAWNVEICTKFHAEDTRCERSCAARLACPIGQEHRYLPEHYAYHAHRESGRRWLRAHLGLDAGADRHEGEGPYWGNWRARVDVKGEAP